MKQHRDMIKSVLVLNKYYILRSKLHCANLHVFIWKEIVIYDLTEWFTNYFTKLSPFQSGATVQLTIELCTVTVHYSNLKIAIYQ